MFSKTARPSSIAVDDAREVVVEEDQVRRFSGDIGAGDAHGDTDIGCPQRRRIVDAVARDRDDVALALKRRHDAQLLIGRDPRADDLRRVERELDLRCPTSERRSSPVSEAWRGSRRPGRSRARSPARYAGDRRSP